MGCGRVGSALGRSIESLGHSVAVIDQSSDSFKRLGTAFGGQIVKGVGYDRVTLVTAGIERAAAFAAVSNGDNSNIIAARVARETFGVEKVVARIYDPRRAAVYQRLGIPTVATVTWTADQILRRLFPEGSTPEWVDPSGMVVLSEVAVGPHWIGTRISALEEEVVARVACLTRLGAGVVPGPDSVVQDGDLLHLTVAKERTSEVEALLAGAPSEGAS